MSIKFGLTPSEIESLFAPSTLSGGKMLFIPGLLLFALEFFDDTLAE
jgi:hypothetical protein